MQGLRVWRDNAYSAGIGFKITISASLSLTLFPVLKGESVREREALNEKNSGESVREREALIEKSTGKSVREREEL
jgi:hypothetical protein